MMLNQSLKSQDYIKFYNDKYLYHNENQPFYDDSGDDIENSIGCNRSKYFYKNPSPVTLVNPEDSNETLSKTNFTKNCCKQDVYLKNLTTSSKISHVPVFSLAQKSKKSSKIYKSPFTNCNLSITRVPVVPKYGKSILSKHILKHSQKINLSIMNNNYLKYRQIINIILKETLKIEKYYRSICKALKATLGELKINIIKSNVCNSSVCKKILQDCLIKYTSIDIRNLCLCVNCQQKNIERKQRIVHKKENHLEVSTQTENITSNQGTQTLLKKGIYLDSYTVVHQRSQSTQTSNLLNISKIMIMKNNESKFDCPPKSVMLTNIKGSECN